MPSSLTVDLGTLTEHDALLVAGALRYLASSLPADSDNASEVRAIAAQVELRLGLARRVDEQNEPVVLDAVPCAFAADVRVGDVVRDPDGEPLRVAAIFRNASTMQFSLARGRLMTVGNGDRVHIVTFGKDARR